MEGNFIISIFRLGIRKTGRYAKNRKVVPRKTTLASRAAQNGIGCDVCKQFTQWAEKELTDLTVTGLWKLISVECPKVPYISKFCALITEEDIQTILNLIIAINIILFINEIYPFYYFIFFLFNFLYLF